MRCCTQPANRELRCDSGTAPPLYSDDVLPLESLAGRKGDRIQAIVKSACFSAVGRSREGMRPPEFVSQKTYQAS